MASNKNDTSLHLDPVTDDNSKHVYIKKKSNMRVSNHFLTIRNHNLFYSTLVACQMNDLYALQWITRIEKKLDTGPIVPTCRLTGPTYESRGTKMMPAKVLLTCIPDIMGPPPWVKTEPACKGLENDTDRWHKHRLALHSSMVFNYFGTGHSPHIANNTDFYFSLISSARTWRSLIIARQVI